MDAKNRAKLLEKLSASLERARGPNRELDMLIALGLAYGGLSESEAARQSGQVLQVLVEEGYPWEMVTELLDEELPAYTGELAATVPGENIVLALRSAKRGKWAALHREEEGRLITAWADQECLARRAAGLKALGARLAREAQPLPEGEGYKAGDDATEDHRSGGQRVGNGAAGLEAWPAPPSQALSERVRPARPPRPVRPGGPRGTPPEFQSDALLQRILRRSAPEPDYAAGEGDKSEAEREWKILF